MRFTEADVFAKRVRRILSEEQYANLKDHLAHRPDAGLVVPGSGGVRKLRWSAKGHGKRGGARVIYYWQVQADEIWLLTLYAKNEQENVSAHELKRMKESFRHD
jgi:hypothetical protein